MILDHLEKAEVIQPPSWLVRNTIYLTRMGSECYGTQLEASDVDLYGICVPRKDIVFPHLAGYIEGFSTNIPHFDQWLQHHITDPDGKEKTYDIQVFNIVKYFSLLMMNNPNVLDSIFVPLNCITHITHAGNLIRENRKMFLHKGSWHKFKGYSYSQLNKASSGNRTGKRKEVFDKYGYDVKFLMHTVRLLYEAEMILSEHDIDLQRHKEHLKAIRRAEVPEEEVRKWVAEKEKFLEKLYEESTLPWGPNEEKIKKLLLECLEHHYGSLKEAISNPDEYKILLKEIKEKCEKAGI